MKTAITAAAGPTAVLERDDIDTDALFPARFLRAVHRAGMGVHLFADWRAEGRPDVDFMHRTSAPHIIVSACNFGCGSSREHAVWALADYGIQAVIALSFGDIFRNNCVKNGIVAATVSVADHARLLEVLAQVAEPTLRLDVASRTLLLPDGSSMSFTLADGHAEQLMSNEDDVDRTLRHEDALHAYEARVQREQPWLASMT